MPNDDLLISMLCRDDEKSEHPMSIDEAIKAWLEARVKASKEIAKTIKQLESNDISCN